MKFKLSEHRTFERYIRRNVEDENFTGSLALLAPLLMWAKTVRVGQRINFNDINMIQLPMEMLEAFVRYHARHENGNGSLHAGCREALKFVRQYEAIMASSGKLALPGPIGGPPSTEDRGAEHNTTKDLS